MNRLTPRETDIARLVARGMTNKEAGAELGITEGTVKIYLHRIYAALEIRGAGSFRVRLAHWFRSQIYE